MASQSKKSKRSNQYLLYKLPALLLGIFVLFSINLSYATGDDGIEKSDVKALAGDPLLLGNNPQYPNGVALLQVGATADLTYSYEYEQTKKITNIISLRVYEETPGYIPVDFTATVGIRLNYRFAGSATNYQEDKQLTVTYTKGEGLKYNARQYIHFENAEYLNVTVLSISPPIGSFDLAKVLVLENEMRVKRYFALKNNVTSNSFQEGSITNGELPLTWSWPADAGHTHTQLEWAWVEGELQDEYMVNGVFDANLLFKNNSTRIDLPVGMNAYSIPLLYGGAGRIYYRIRAVNIKSTGYRTDGPWNVTTSQYTGYAGHASSMNWQSTINFSEEGKRKAVIQYFDGSLRGRQTLAKDNVTNTVVASEVFYDGAGRAAVQILPTPTTSTVVEYITNLNLFNGQVDNQDPAEIFDLQPVNSTSSIVPILRTDKGSSKYYSPYNAELPANTGTALPAVPDAEGYPYSVTRYTPDGTDRVMTQSAPGAATRMGSGHETKYYYGTPAQEELDGLFGTEVGVYTHYYKNMVKDANGQMTISYVDMHGRTIATALAGEAPNLIPLDVNQTNYINQTPNHIYRNLINSNTNVVKNNSLESLTSLLVPVSTTYNFRYKLDPESLQLAACDAGNTPICYECLYDLEISIVDESGEQDPIIRKFNNISVAPNDNCSATQSTFKNADGSAATDPLQIDISLLPGSYSIRKTLTISEASLQTYKELYITKGMCKTEQQLIDSVTTVLLSGSDCATPPAPYTCATCTSPLPTKRQMMLADMIPFSGQYATETGSGTMYNRYNIFSTLNGFSLPFYRDPRNSAKNPDLYRTIDGSVDQFIQPGSTTANLTTVSKEQFNEWFAYSWAEALLPHHPEYDKLVFAENNLTTSYNWINTFNNTNTYAQAVANGYIFTNINNLNDPFYSTASTYKSDMVTKISGNYKNNLSIWKIAYGDVACQSYVIPDQKNDCYRNASPTPPYNNLTTAENDRVWMIFRNLYAMERNEHVNAYITSSVPLSNAQTLVDQGYKLHFTTSNAQLAQQYNWTWYPATAGDPPNINNIPGASSPTDIYASRCNSYITQWTNALLKCDALALHPNKTAIINQITAAMVEVCKKGSDEANPLGSSNVADGVTASPSNFEDVINTILSNNGIPRDYLCNPYVIEFPKPYNKGPEITKTIVTQIEKCHCDQFAKLKTEAVAQGVNTSNFNLFNEWLYTNYGGTLTEALFNGLTTGCPNINKTACYNTYSTVVVPNTTAMPCECSVVGVSGNTLTYSCLMRICNDNKYFPLAAGQPMPEFLKCGYKKEANCFTCAKFSEYIAQFKSLIPAPYNNGPVLNTNDLSETDIQANVLFARFMNYKTGMQYTWLEYAQSAKATGCNLANYASNSSAMQQLICGSTKPLSDPTGIFVTEDPCQGVKNMAVSIAQNIYKQRQEFLLARFEDLYRAKCMAAGNIEQFWVEYDNKEYHYTLYYYDMAGNLVKTVPPKGVYPDFSRTETDAVKADRANGTIRRRPHSFVTNYRYNSLNQSIAQNTPDAGASKFWFDKVGRLVISQQAQQAADNKYTYTLYDEFSRIKEVGQKPQSTLMTQTISQDEIALNNWINVNGGTKEQITYTEYDLAYPPTLGTYMTQKNLRNRISYTYFKNLATDLAHHTATFYTYDIHGSVEGLLQDYQGIPEMFNANKYYKLITYEYDLISGKVNLVNYQPGDKDAFYHRYNYDAENQLLSVETSRDKIYWERDAAYSYYKHGKKSRLELGKLRVQGLDYAYTLKGWLKGVNSTTIGNGAYDIGKDGYTGANNWNVARDVIGFGLHYYDAVENSVSLQDYKPIGITNAFARPDASTGFVSLYNGNIGATSMNNEGLGRGILNTNNASPLFYKYRYDQLNRFKSMDTYKGLANNVWTAAPILDYGELVDYDPNGNIVSYIRRGAPEMGMPGSLDFLTYHYEAGSNRLDYVHDDVSTFYTEDIESQGVDNYEYDLVGNLKRDGTTTITWNVYGKMTRINKNGNAIDFTYDAVGNRISKRSLGILTVYVRDASGNVLSVYQTPSAGTPVQKEVHLYGAGRMGMITELTEPVQTTSLSGAQNLAIISTFTRNEKVFELCNHLGNVLATIGDKSLQHSSNNTAVDYYMADVMTANDYYPFGMIMPGRNYTINTYRYGFNGKENDNEVKSEGNQQDYGMRIYDPRLGIFLSIDPLTADYPGWSPYPFAMDRPIDGIDMDGLEYTPANTSDDNNQKVRESTSMQKGIDPKTIKVNPNNFVVNNPILFPNGFNGKDMVYQSRPTISQANPPTNAYQAEQQRLANERNWVQMGYNPDGTKGFLMRLSENKTWNAFADNLALPLLEGYGYASGLIELRAAFMSMGKKWVRVGHWMPKKNYDEMVRTGRIVAEPNTDGQAFFSTAGAADYGPSATVEYVYAEFDVEAKNLIKSGKDIWWRSVTSGSKNKVSLFKLNKQGGVVDPKFRNLSRIKFTKWYGDNYNWWPPLP